MVNNCGGKQSTSAENLTIPEVNCAICRETTALRQFDNKLIELRTLNTGRTSGMSKKGRRYAQQDMDAFPFSKGLVIMAANVITSFLNIVH